MAIEVTNADFESVVINSTIPVVVDVWATWCGPCRQLAPTIEALAEKYAGRVLVVKANIDQNSKAVADYGIRSIPMLLWFTKGKDDVLSVGILPQEMIEGLIDAKLLETME
jgi:thioredoxin 1